MIARMKFVIRNIYTIQCTVTINEKERHNLLSFEITKITKINEQEDFHNWSRSVSATFYTQRYPHKITIFFFKFHKCAIQTPLRSVRDYPKDWERTNERKKEKQKRTRAFLRSHPYSPCLAEDCEVFRIPPGAGDPVCRAAAPWPTTQNQRGVLTLKCCLPAMQPGNRVSTGIAIPLERWSSCRNCGSMKRMKKKKREKGEVHAPACLVQPRFLI